MENENEKICKYCGNIIADGDNIVTVNTVDGDKIEVHYDCALQNAFYCDHCGEYHENKVAHYMTANGDTICEYCYDDAYFTCEDCGEIYHTDDLCYAPNDSYYCQDCYDDRFVTCQNCGCAIYRDDAYYNNGDPYCEDCFCDLEGEDDGRIYNYHGFDDWRLYKAEGENEPPFYIGYELEVEHKHDGTETQSKTLDILENNLNVVFMHDGSLNDHGFEIVSHPQSYQYILENKNKYFEVFEAMRQNGYISHDSSHCGLHFHLTAPNDYNIRKEVVNRIWIILETYKNEIAKLSRRRGDFHYCQFLTDRGQLKSDVGAFYFIKKTDTTCSRYLALNNENSKTLEFRFFRGTLNANTFFANLEFINNIYKIATDLSIDLTTIDWNRLIEGDFIKEYCHKNGVLTDKKIIDDSLKYIEIENKINRLIVNIRNICLKQVKQKYNNLLKEIIMDKVKDFDKMRNCTYILKENFVMFNSYTKYLQTLFNNSRDLGNFCYYFKDYDTRQAFSFFLDEKSTETIAKKYDKIINYKKQLENGGI